MLEVRKCDGIVKRWRMVMGIGNKFHSGIMKMLA